VSGGARFDRRTARVRAVYEASNRGDFELARESFHADVELVQPAELPGGAGVYRGEEGMVRAVEELLEAYEYFQMDPEEYFVSEDHVVVTVRVRGRGRASGLEVDDRYGHVFTFRGDRVARFEVFTNPEDALAAAGLSGRT
jgi:ketosteroid isomerase-like protein